MNPFLEWLNSLFKKKEFEMPTPNAYPQYERGPVTAEEVSPEAWNQRFASPLADSLRQMGSVLQPKPKAGDIGNSMGYVAESSFFNNMPTEMAFNTNPKVYGRYRTKNPEEDTTLAKYRQSPAGNVFDPRRVMIHEYGHLANSSTPGDRGAFPRSSDVSKMLYNTWLLHEGKNNELESLPIDFDRIRMNPTSPALGSISAPAYKAIASVDPYYRTHPSEAFSQAFVNAFEFLAETARDPKMDYRKFAGDLEANTPGMGLIIQDMLKLPLYKNHPLRGQIFTEKKK